MLRDGVLILVLCSLGLVAAAHAAPLPRARSIPAGVTFDPLPATTSATAGTRVEAERALGPGRVCGTVAESGAEALRAHLARAELTASPTPYSTDTLGIAVLEDDGTFFYTDKDNHRLLDVVALGQAFYRTHGDDYDFIAAFLSSGNDVWLGSVNALASCTYVRNDTYGLGLELFDLGAAFGSAARLQSFLTLNGLDRYPADPDVEVTGGNFSTLDVIAHELGHRWLAYTFVDSSGTVSPALLGRDLQHWNFFMDSDSSLEEGCDWARPVPPDSFRSDGVTHGFSALDQYLMGLRPRGDVDSFFVINDPTSFDPAGTYVRSTSPMTGLGCRGRATFWRVEDIEAVHGPRLPDWAAAPHTFRVAFVLVTARDTAASPADLEKVVSVRDRYVPYFAEAVQGNGSMDPTLDSRAGQVTIAFTPLKDTEDAEAARTVSAQVTIAQAGIRLAVDPASVQACWRVAGSGAFTPVVLAPAAGDLFAGALPPQPAGTTVEYYLYASSDSAGIEAYDPPGGAAAPHAYRVGPDVTPPVVLHAPVRRQGLDRLPQTLLARVTDNLGLDSVWVEYAVDGGAPATRAVAAAGSDSFQVGLGAGLEAGQRLAYRFVARDASLAANLGTSRADFDTLGVERDWTVDFENGAEGFTHGIQWWSYRDAWHLTQEESSPPGGTAWKCGAAAPLTYPPHLDANLYTPSISGIEAGTTLVFDHRYALEDTYGAYASDGARLEISVDGGAWQVLVPEGGYNARFWSDSNPFQRDTPCWGGSSDGWRIVTADLSPYAPGPVRVRFRLLADEYVGADGWFVDRVRVLYVGGALEAPLAVSAPAIGRPWPNPARDALRVSLSLPRAAEVEWALYDVAGRRVARLWRDRASAGSRELRASLPALPAGLYFSCLTLDGLPAASGRVAVVR